MDSSGEQHTSPTTFSQTGPGLLEGFGLTLADADRQKPANLMAAG